MSKDNIAEGTFQRSVERYKPEGAVTGRVSSPIPTVEDADDAVHLHWLWEKGSDALAGVTSAVAICGAKSLPRKFITQKPEEATCAKCKRLAL